MVKVGQSLDCFCYFLLFSAWKSWDIWDLCGFEATKWYQHVGPMAQEVSEFVHLCSAQKFVKPCATHPLPWLVGSGRQDGQIPAIGTWRHWGDQSIQWSILAPEGRQLGKYKIYKKIKQFIEFCELVTHKPPKKISGNSKSTCMGLGI